MHRICRLNKGILNIYEEETVSEGSMHAPVAEGQCTGCHNPHQSKLNSLLQAENPPLCLVCHTDFKEKMAEGKVHAPAGRDCLRCHQPHSAALSKLIDQPLHTLCAECHELDSETFRQSHISIEAADMNCMNCHDPHSSKDQKFFKPVMHAPFASRTCDACHIAEKK